VTETLDYVPGRFKVLRHVREKLSCRACDTVVAAPAPDHAIARGRAGAGLLAHIMVSKYDDHLPLYRQAEIFAREGVNLETSTPAFARAGSCPGGSGRPRRRWRRWSTRSPPR
jgi:transposase